MVTVTATMVALCFQTNAEWTTTKSLIVLLTKTFHWIHQKSSFNTKNMLISSWVGRMCGWQNASVPFLRAGAWSHGTHAKVQASLIKLFTMYWVELQISSIIQVANIIVKKKKKWWYNKLHRLSDMPINQYAKFSSVDLPEICHKLYVYLTPWTRPLNIPCTVYTMNQWLLNWCRGYF